jgi:hypothetical protein
MTNPSTKSEKGRFNRIGKIIRVAGKIFLWLLGGIVSLLFLLWVVVLIAFPDDKIRRLFTAALSEQLGVPVEAASLELSLFRGLVLKDVKIGAPPGFSSAPLQVDEVVVEYSLGELVERKFTVRKLWVVHPVLTIESRDKRTNLQALLENQKLSQPAEGATEKTNIPLAEKDENGFLIALEAVQFKDIALRYKSNEFDLDLRGGNLDLTGQLGAGQLSVSGTLLLPCPEKPNVSVRFEKELPIPKKLEAAFGMEIKFILDGLKKTTLSGGFEIKGMEATPGVGDHRVAGEFSLEIEPAGEKILSGFLKVLLDDELILSTTMNLSGENPKTVWLEVKHLSLISPAMISLLQGFERRLIVHGSARVEDLRLRGELSGSEWPKVSGRLLLDKVSVSSPWLTVSSLGGVLRFGLEPDASGFSPDFQAETNVASLRIGTLESKNLRLNVNAKGVVRPSGQGWLGENLTCSWELQADLFRSAFGQAKALEMKGTAEVGKEPIEVSPQGIDVSELNLKLRGAVSSLDNGKQKAEALWLDARATVKKLALDRTAGLSMENISGGLHARVAKAEAQGARFNASDLQLEFDGGAASGGVFEGPIRIRSKVHLDSPSLARFAAKQIDLEANTRLEQFSSPEIPLALSLEVQRPEWGGGGTASDAPMVLDHVGLKYEGKIDLQKRVAVASKLSVDVDRWAGLSVSGWFSWLDRRFSLRFETSPLPIEKMWALLPSTFRTSWPAWKGQMGFSLQAEGSVPELFALERLPISGEAALWLRGVSGVALAPGLELNNLSGQIKVSRARAGAEGEKGSLNMTLDGLSFREGLWKARGISVAAELKRENGDLEFNGRLGVEKNDLNLSTVRAFPKVSAEINARWTGSKELSLQRLRVQLPSWGLQLNAEGRVVIPPAAKDWRDFILSGDASADFQSNETIQFPWGFSATGEGGIAAKIVSAVGGVFNVQGKAAFAGFDFAQGALILKGMRGGIPLSQRVATVPTFGLLSEAASPSDAKPDKETDTGKRSSGYEDALRPLKGESRTFSIREVLIRDQKFSNVSGNLELTGGHLGLKSLRFELLRGDVLANMDIALAPPGTRLISLTAEMSGMDLSGLGALSLAGSSEVSGNMNLDIDFSGRKIKAGINLTQIGQSTLQSLLLAVDPQKKTPGVVKLRKYMDQFKVSPERVSLNIRHGLLQMEVAFDMGLLAKVGAKLIDGFEGSTFRLSPQPVSGFLAKYLTF